VSVVLVDWQVLHWIQTDGADITHGQPIAINEALQRWRHLHDFMAFYDTDEFLVLPGARNLDDFVARFAAVNGPVVALRSPCAWMMLNLTHSNLTSIADATVPDLVRLPVERGPAGGREKYFLNTSAIDDVGIKTINLHGSAWHARARRARDVHATLTPLIPSHHPRSPRAVYSHQNNAPGNAVVLRGDQGYHLHVLNEIDSSRKQDSREVFLPKHKVFLDTEVGTFVRAAITARVAARHGH